MSDPDKPYKTSPDAYKDSPAAYKSSPDSYNKTESTSARAQREMRELHRRPAPPIELHGDVKFSQGADGATVAIIGGVSSATPSVPQFTGYPWIAQALDDPMTPSDGWDVVMGDQTAGNVTTAPALIQLFKLLAQNPAFTLWLFNDGLNNFLQLDNQASSAVVLGYFNGDPNPALDMTADNGTDSVQIALGGLSGAGNLQLQSYVVNPGDTIFVFK